MTRYLLLTLTAALPLAAQTPVETGVYRCGAWFPINSDEGLARYQQAGFNLIQYSDRYADWAVEHGFQFIHGVSQRGLPANVNQPFEAHDGTRSMSVGLFTSINFNAPTVAAWWQTAVPEQVRATKHADQVAYWKVHNEFGYHAAKYWDYSPGSIAKYRRWLTGRYASIADLNTKWGTRFASFEAVEPPRTLPPDSLANWLEWRRYTSWSFADYFSGTDQLIESVVPGAKTSDNLYPTTPLQGWDMFELARQTDYVAFDLYEIGRWERLARGLDLGRSAAAAWDKPFSMMEYHSGPNNWVHAVTAEDLWIEAAMALGRECRSIQWFRFAPGGGGREQGIHAVVATDGGPTERLTAVRDISEKTARLAPLLASTRTHPPVAILTSSDDSYLGAAQRTSEWAARAMADRLASTLDDAYVAHEQLDPIALVAREKLDYRAILVAGMQVVGDEVHQQLRQFIAGGGTVLWFAGSDAYDAYGNPRRQRVPLADEPRGPWTAPVRETADGLQAAWGLETPADPAVATQRSQALATLLLARAKVEPIARLTTGGVAGRIDVQRVTDARADLLFFSHQYLKGMLWDDDWDYHTERAPRNVVVDLPANGVRGEVAYAFLPGSGAVERWPIKRQGERVSFTIPQLAPTAWVLLPRQWQPLVGISLPGRVMPGATVAVTVTVDNLGAEAVAGSVALAAPAGWSAQAPGQAAFTGLAPDGRAAVTFQVAVPADAKLDPFAVEHGLTATVTFTSGRRGSLSATATPVVAPPLAAELVYHAKLLNPQQEMAPPIMRWGWEREVTIPPPPPVAVRADAPVGVTIHGHGGLVGRTATLSLEPEGRVQPQQVRLDNVSQPVNVVLTMQEVGPHRLVLEAGGARAVAAFEAGLNDETVAAQLARVPEAPARFATLGRIVVGARGAPARLTPVVIPVDLPARNVQWAQVLDEQGRPIPAQVMPGQVVLAADIPANETRRYTVADWVARSRGPATPHAVTSEATESGLLVSGQGYGVEFDTRLGLIRRMLGPDGVVVAPHRTGVVAKLATGEEWAPDGRTGATDLSTAVSPVTATVQFGRTLGPQRALQVAETWRLEGHRIAVALTVRNVSPGTIDLASLDYELGFDPEALPRWRQVGAGGQERGGALPESMTANETERLIDILDAAGAGYGVRLGRNALASKWQAGFAGLFHSAARTRIGLFGGIRLDPADYVLTEFELWPHESALAVGEAMVPEIVQAAKAVGPE